MKLLNYALYPNVRKTLIRRSTRHLLPRGEGERDLAGGELYIT
ncbi:MAG TPA: hypothetical protein VNM92_07520 [Thermoanaerobaculia bacterium]|nr:hypothetical protein [Thermoanaerobaculia bacterium]